MPTPKKSPPSLPPGLTALQIEKAVEYVEAKAAELVDLYYEQANLFSGIVGILGVQALDTYSPYKKHKHPDIAQQRFPDLSFNGRLNPPPLRALESKGSTRPWAVQSHYDHPGWYIVWRYLVDSTKSIKAGKEVMVWRISCFSRRQTGSTRGAPRVLRAAAARIPLDFGRQRENSWARQYIKFQAS